MPPTKSNRVYLVGGFIALGVGLAAWLLSQSGDAGGPGGEAAASRATARHAPGTEAASPATTPRQRNARMDEPRYGHSAEQMVDFIVADVEGRDVSLRAAMGILMAAYKDACRQSRTKPLDFAFAHPESDARISFHIERTNFMAALRHIAALAGFEAAMIDADITFTPLDPRPGTATAADEVAISPELAAHIRKTAAHLGVAPGTDDPVANLRALGLFDAEGSALGQARLATLMDTLPDGRVLVAHLSILHAADPLPLESPYPSDKEVAAWLELASDKSATIISSPSLTLRDRQDSNIGMIQTEGPDGWTGVKINVMAERMGLAVVSRDTVRHRPDDSLQPLQQNTGYTALLPGDTHICIVGEQDGTTTYRMLSLQVVTPGGRPGLDAAGRPTHPVATAVPGMEGFVFSPYNNAVIDVRGINSGTLVADPTYPSTERKVFRTP